MAENTNDSPNLAPSSSPELGRLFKLDQSVDSQAQPTSPPPGNLPSYEDVDVPIEVIESQQMGASAVTRPQVETTDEAVRHAHEKHQSEIISVEKGEQVEQDEPQPQRSRAGRVAKKLIPYLLVFAIGIGLYFFYFNSFSFTSLFKGGSQATPTQKVDSAALTALEQSEKEGYNSWISQFFFDVSDPSIVDMNTDVSGNGLTNFQKYLLNLNPKIYDTLGDSQGDGQKIIDGKNPWTGLALTEAQQKIADNYFDKELISNRIAAAQAKPDNSAFAPYVSNHSPYYQAGVSNVVNGDAVLVRGSASTTGAVAGIATTTASAAPAPRSATIPGSTRDNSASSLGIDTSKPGSINIPSINVTVPLVWSSDPKNFEADLKNGVIHYPGTPLPGDMGTSYISGHSSGYFWDKSQYKVAFARLGNVKTGDTFTVTVTLKSGQQAILHYRVDGRAEYAADDPRQFLQSSDSVVALSTCWPVNTTARRLVLYGILTQVEK